MPLDEKQRMKIVAKLTDAQKTVIKRDFINHFLCEDAYGDNSASKLLRDFANMHFPDQYGLAKEPPTRKNIRNDTNAWKSG